MSNFNKRVVKGFTTKTEKVSAIEYTTKNDKKINVDIIRKVYEKMRKEKGEQAKIVVKAELPNTWYTLKGFDGEYKSDDKIDEYFNGKVKKTEKFTNGITKFYFYVREPINNEDDDNDN